MEKEQEKIKHDKTIRALVDNDSYVLTGGKPVTLAEASPLALQISDNPEREADRLLDQCQS